MCRWPRQRLQAVQPALAEALVFAPTRRERPRVPFGRLVEQGYLQVGQELTFGNQGEIKAAVLANGHLRCGELVGSIHMIGRQLLQAPCNGWEHWFFKAPDGSRQPIDLLREAYLQQAHQAEQA